MKRLGLAIVLLLALTAAPANAARKATVTGKLTGAKLPKNGRIPVWALRLTDGRVVAGTYATTKGKFTLKTPKGPHAILAAVVTRTGKRDAVVRVADFVTAKPGKRMRIKPTLKKRKKKRKARSSALAHAAWVDVDYPMLWVHRWTTSDPEFKVMEKGMQDLMITDLSALIGQPPCNGGIGAGDDLSAVLGEIGLTQSRYFDPRTRLTTAHLIRTNGSVTGTMTRANGMLTVTATYQDQRPGSSRTGTVTVTGPEGNIFDLEQSLAAKLARVICIETPQTYAGTFSGTYTNAFNDYKVTWTGDAIIELQSEHGSPPPGGPEPLDYRQYTVKSGQVHATLTGTRIAGSTCTIRGEATFSLPTGFTAGIQSVQANVDRPWFALGIGTYGTEQIPYTETGALGCNQQNPQYPLAGLLWVNTPEPLQSADGIGLTGNSTWGQPGFSHFTSAFSFTPAS
jgi:hypothetical protein